MGTRARRAISSSPNINFHECFYNAWEHGGDVFYFFYGITCKELKRGNSLLYQSVNSPYTVQDSACYCQGVAVFYSGCF